MTQATLLIGMMLPWVRVTSGILLILAGALALSRILVLALSLVSVGVFLLLLPSETKGA